MVAAGALATTVGHLPKPAAASLDEIRIGYLPITDASLLLTAHAQGYLADRGLAVAQPRLFRSWGSLVEAFVAGEINLTHMLNPIPVWLRFNNGVPAKVVAWGHVNGSAILVGPDTGITAFEQLGGRRMAIPSPYSVHNIILQRKLRAAGLEPVVTGSDTPVAANQVALTVMPPPDMVRALGTGEIAGYTVAEPFNAMGEMISQGRILRFTGDVWKNHPCCVITMHEDAIAAAPETTGLIAEALVDAALYATADRPGLAQMLSREGQGYLPMPSGIIETALTNYSPATYGGTGAIQHPDWGVSRIDFNPYPYHSATRTLIEALSETAIDGETRYAIDRDPDEAATELVDARFIEAALSRVSGWEQRLGADTASPFARDEVITG